MCLVDVVGATDVSAGATVVFGSFFLTMFVVAIRMLTSRVVLGPSALTAVGVLPAKRFPRSNVVGVSTDARAMGGHRLALETTSGQRLLPMMTSGSRTQREALASEVSAWLSADTPPSARDLGTT